MKLCVVSAMAFELKPPPSERPSWSVDESEAEFAAETTDGQTEAEQCEEYVAYQEKVKRFLLAANADRGRGKKPKDERRHRSPYRTGATDRLCVDHLNRWITADDLYVAMGFYGPVRSVRVDTAAASVLGYGPGRRVDRIARVRFERTDSVDRAMADHVRFGCTIRGVRLSIRRSAEPGSDESSMY